MSLHLRIFCEGLILQKSIKTIYSNATFYRFDHYDIITVLFSCHSLTNNVNNYNEGAIRIRNEEKAWGLLLTTYFEIELGIFFSSQCRREV